MSTTLLGDDNSTLRSTVQDLIDAAGYGEDEALENIMLNAIAYFNESAVSLCEGDQNGCFSLLNDTYWQQDTLADYGIRSWNYQVCTEWGYYQSGHTPSDILPLFPRTVDLAYLSNFCRAGFNLTSPPDTDKVNKYGGFDISYPRLAIIGGNADPWRPASPLADAAKPRNSTTEEPFLEIAHAVHHWEENGIFKNETTPILPPNQIVYAQQFLKDFVVEWLKGEYSVHYYVLVEANDATDWDKERDEL